MEHCDFAAIEALLRRHGFHFSKSMGQNFLIDATIPAAIAEASEAGEGNGVLEIGPGHRRAQPLSSPPRGQGRRGRAGQGAAAHSG